MKGCFTDSRMFRSARVCAVSLALRTILAWKGRVWLECGHPELFQSLQPLPFHHPLSLVIFIILLLLAAILPKDWFVL